jgi:hypothetical protein
MECWFATVKSLTPLAGESYNFIGGSPVAT